MNDLRICNQIAELESLKYWNYLGKCVLKAPWSWGEESPEYNPLTDDALCFRLMIKYRMQLSRLPNLDYICKKQGVFVNINSTTKGITSPNKAICLAIIELNKGK
tara:strand:- start:675 stop:989 length:315 start_codon:yes stop_codon:yes gene_type:complete